MNALTLTLDLIRDGTDLCMYTKLYMQSGSTNIGQHLMKSAYDRSLSSSMPQVSVDCEGVQNSKLTERPNPNVKPMVVVKIVAMR